MTFETLHHRTAAHAGPSAPSPAEASSHIGETPTIAEMLLHEHVSSLDEHMVQSAAQRLVELGGEDGKGILPVAVQVDTYETDPNKIYQTRRALVLPGMFQRGHGNEVAMLDADGLFFRPVKFEGDIIYPFITQAKPTPAPWGAYKNVVGKALELEEQHAAWLKEHPELYDGAKVAHHILVQTAIRESLFTGKLAHKRGETLVAQVMTRMGITREVIERSLSELAAVSEKSLHDMSVDYYSDIKNEVPQQFMYLGKAIKTSYYDPNQHKD